MEQRIELKFCASINEDFVEKSIKHMGFKIQMNESNLLVATQSFSLTEIEKVCCMSKDLLDIQGLIKLQWIRYKNKDKKKNKKKISRFKKPFAFVLYSTIGFLLSLIAIAIAGCIDVYIMIAGILIATGIYFFFELEKYKKEIYEKHD